MRTRTPTKKSKLPPRQRSQFKAAEVALAITKYSGNMTAMAKHLKVTRAPLIRFVYADPALVEMLDDARDARLDRAETALDKQVENGEMAAICFLLKTQGAKRGYIERREVVYENAGLTREQIEARLREAGINPDMLVTKRVTVETPVIEDKSNDASRSESIS